MINVAVPAAGDSETKCKGKHPKGDEVTTLLILTVMKVGSTQLTKWQSEHERKRCCVSGEAAKATVRMHSTAKSTVDRKTSLRCDLRYLVHVVGGGVRRDR